MFHLRGKRVLQKGLVPPRLDRSGLSRLPRGRHAVSYCGRLVPRLCRDLETKAAEVAHQLSTFFGEE